MKYSFSSLGQGCWRITGLPHAALTKAITVAGLLCSRSITVNTEHLIFIRATLKSLAILTLQSVRNIPSLKVLQV